MCIITFVCPTSPTNDKTVRSWKKVKPRNMQVGYRSGLLMWEIKFPENFSVRKFPLLDPDKYIEFDCPVSIL